MKKSLFAAALMIAALLLTACHGNGNSAVKSISLKPAELTLTPEGSTRLSLVVEPENAKYNSDDLVWASSDTTVAYVKQNGEVTALEKGTANITVKLGDLTAVCALTVKDWVENLTFTGVFIGLYDTLAYCGLDTNKLDTIEDVSGKPYLVKRVQAWVSLYTAGFYLNNEYKLAGSNEGGETNGFGPMYWAPAWANHSELGTVFSLGAWEITSDYALDTVSNVIPCGTTNDQFIPNMKLFLENLVAGDQTTAYSVNLADAGEKGCEGTLLTHYQYHTTAEGYPEDSYYAEYLPELFMTDGYFYADLNYTASDVLKSVEAHHLTARALRSGEVNDTDFYLYGCYWHYDDAAQTYTWLDEDVHYAEETYTYNYNLDFFSTLGAPARGNVLQYKNLGKVADIETTRMVMNKLHSVPVDPKSIRK